MISLCPEALHHFHMEKIRFRSTAVSASFGVVEKVPGNVGFNFPNVQRLGCILCYLRSIITEILNEGDGVTTESPCGVRPFKICTSQTEGTIRLTSDYMNYSYYMEHTATTMKKRITHFLQV